MPNVWVNDDTFYEYVEEHGSPEGAKEAIQEMVEERSPGGDR